MLGIQTIAATALASAFLALTAAPAAAADPVMALADVRPGMQCTGYSVVRGTEPVAFDVEILDIVAGDDSLGRPRLLVSVGGPALDPTGLGPGFSGSPVYCRGSDGVARVAGAISESVGEYGGKVALATPIEAMLDVPVDPPPGAVTRHVRGRTLAAPLTVSGLSAPLARAVQESARRAGRTILAAPSRRLSFYPPQILRPGSAMAASLAAGDLGLSAIGTVTYVDGDRVWGFGHQLDGLGRRSLILQDAYVHRVINNPAPGFESTYKLAAPGHTVGTLTSDGFAAVAGRTGTTPPTVPVVVRTLDRNTRERRTADVQAADETDVGNPAGASPVSLAAPLTVAQAATAILGASPPRLYGSMCTRIELRERRRAMGFCNRYVTDTAAGGFFGFGNGVATAAADDVAAALELVDAFDQAPLHVEQVTTDMSLLRASRLVHLRGVSMPRRVRRGQRVRVTLTVQPTRGELRRRSFRMRIPHGTRGGTQRLRFRGTEADGQIEDELLDFLSTPARRARGAGVARPSQERAEAAIERLAARVARLHRYDGVTARIPGVGRAVKVYRDRQIRIAGRASARVEVRPAARRGRR